MKKKYLILGVALTVLIGAVITTSSIRAEERGESTLKQVVQDLKDLKSVLTELRGLGDDLSAQVEEELTLGATPGQDFSNRITVGGVPLNFHRVRFANATSTVCSVRSPNATSTLAMFVISGSTATSSATIFEVGTSTSFAGTTTLLASATFAANVQPFLIATSTRGGSAGTNGSSTDTIFIGDLLIPPRTMVNVNAGAVYGNLSAGQPNNFCTYEFIEVGAGAI